MPRAVILGIAVFPLAEIALFVVIGGWIGVWPTLALVVLAAVAGVTILRGRGLSAARALRRPMAGLQPVADGALIAIAGVLLILPGFLSDAMALLLLIPPLRRMLITTVATRIIVYPAEYRPEREEDIIDIGNPPLR